MKTSKTNPLVIPDLIYLERYVNVGTRTYSKMSSYTELPEQYRPETHEIPFFEIQLFTLPRLYVECTVANPSSALYNHFIHNDEMNVSFAVHPVVFEVNKTNPSPWIHLLQNPRQHLKTSLLRVTPFASSRSLLVLDLFTKTNRPLPSFVVKCHCPVRISRYYRNLGPRTIHHSILMSGELESIDIPILPETIGISLPATKDGKYGWGFLIREMTPRPIILHRETKLIPCFSLYGLDLHHLDDEPLLIQLIRHQSKKSPADYILDYIMIPIIQNFCRAFLHLGILLEAHGQNVLLEIDSNTNEPLRVVHRDFDLVVDSRIRRARGLQLESFSQLKFKHGLSDDQPEGGWLSMIYDSSIGHHHFSYLAKLIENYFSIPASFVQEQCQKAFIEAFPNSKDYFPEEIHYYSDTPIDEDIYPVVSTGKKPIWRPS
ncbi:hypothetical protein I4U23_004207 [Adineta vaga]|nr:hypothetical protein I4U23_004207 [Adineta vaga]